MDTFVGYCSVDLVDEHRDVTFPMAVMYPALTPGKSEELGRYVMDIAKDADPKEGIYPLVIISHGSGGSHLAYWTLAHHLARNGFIVGMPEHPGNNRNDNSLMNTVDNLVNRPWHVIVAINWFFFGQEICGIIKAGFGCNYWSFHGWIHGIGSSRRCACFVSPRVAGRTFPGDQRNT
jgi:hypothetical protein